MIAALPATGASAATPGYAVAVLIQREAATMIAKPHQPSGTADLPRRISDGDDSASRPPTANSQAGVGNEKNAHGGTVCVQRSEIRNDPIVTALSTQPASHLVLRASNG